jgi:hypothetical protein
MVRSVCRIAAALQAGNGIVVVDWRKHISALSPDVEFNPPARPEEIRDAETMLNVAFPESLRELWSQSNGLIDRYGGWFVWSTDEIVKRNLEMRTFPRFEELFMPFDPLLFLATREAGTCFSLRSAAVELDMSSCSDGITKPTAEYWRNIISRRLWKNSSLRRPNESSLHSEGPAPHFPA